MRLVLLQNLVTHYIKSKGPLRPVTHRHQLPANTETAARAKTKRTTGDDISAEPQRGGEEIVSICSKSIRRPILPDQRGDTALFSMEAGWAWSYGGKLAVPDVLVENVESLMFRDLAV